MSIVTPSFQQAEFLGDAIQSVAAQDYPNLEYLVMDGGSTDGSVDMIRRHERSIHAWVSEPDGGQAQAINKGFARATGDIVAWLNADDMLLPGAVSQAVRALEAAPKAPLVYGNCVFVNRQGQFLRYFTEVEAFDARRLSDCSDYIMQPTAYFRREALEKAGPLDEALSFGLDWDLWCRLSQLGDFVYLPELLAANRDYGTTKTRAGGGRRLRELAGIWRRHRSSPWPTILFGLAGTEAEQLERAAGRRSVRLALRAIRRFLSLGARRNLGANLRSRKEPLCGINPHSPLCRRIALVVVPVFRPVQTLVVVVAAPFRAARLRPQLLEIVVNGLPIGTVGFKGDFGPQTHSFPLPSSVTEQHVARVELRFSEEYANGIAARLEQLLLV